MKYRVDNHLGMIMSLGLDGEGMTKAEAKKVADEMTEGTGREHTVEELEKGHEPGHQSVEEITAAKPNPLANHQPGHGVVKTVKERLA